MATGKIDFKAIADAALARAEQLLAQWLPQGEKRVNEWVVGSLDGEKGSSLSINIRTGVWKDFAGEDTGGDLISLYAAIHRIDQGTAAREIADSLGMAMPGKGDGKRAARSKPAPAAKPAGDSPEPEKEPTTYWVPILPVPDDAGAPDRAHVKRGKPEFTWAYHDAEGKLLGYVYRFVTSDGGKEVLPHCFAEHSKSKKREWRWMSFPEPRPLYRLDKLSPAELGKPVLVVEGEKCADAAADEPDLLAKFDVVSWPGGGGAAQRANWGVLAGRMVLIWPDCDAKRDKNTQELLPEAKQPGVKTAERIAADLVARGCTVRIIKVPAPGEKKDGWDIADAIAEDKWSPAEILAFMRNQRLPARPDEPKERKAPDAAPIDDDGAPAGADEDWKSYLIYKRGELASCLSNVYDILLNEPQWHGVLGYDEFADRVIKLKPPPFHGGVAGWWIDRDDKRAAMWLARKHNFTPSHTLTCDAVETLASRFSYHPVRDWLRGLKWDGVERLNGWLLKTGQIAHTEYSWRVARWYLMGMVARVMKPGSKFDNCLVLEGKQGRGKSGLLGILGGQWFADTDLDLGNKDSMSALAGVWVYEFAELGALARGESLKQKSFLTRQVDHYRPAYGRREIDVPRQCVFGGSTNDWEWNKDPTGGRRFWPVEVGALDLDWLRENREQLFAEALAAYVSGERYWPTFEEQESIFDPEQLKREIQEPYVDILHDWVFARINEFSLADAAIGGANLDSSKLTRDTTTRIGIALRKLGCERIERRNGITRYWYKPPPKSAKSSDPVAYAQGPREEFGGQIDDNDPIPL